MFNLGWEVVRLGKLIFFWLLTCMRVSADDNETESTVGLCVSSVSTDSTVLGRKHLEKIYCSVPNMYRPFGVLIPKQHSTTPNYIAFVFGITSLET